MKYFFLLLTGIMFTLAMWKDPAVTDHFEAEMVQDHFLICFLVSLATYCIICAIERKASHESN
jgi:hypothetical protein